MIASLHLANTKKQSSRTSGRLASMGASPADAGKKRMLRGWIMWTAVYPNQKPRIDRPSTWWEHPSAWTGLQPLQTCCFLLCHQTVGVCRDKIVRLPWTPHLRTFVDVASTTVIWGRPEGNKRPLWQLCKEVTNERQPIYEVYKLLYYDFWHKRCKASSIKWTRIRPYNTQFILRLNFWSISNFTNFNQ